MNYFCAKVQNKFEIQIFSIIKIKKQFIFKKFYLTL